MNLMSIIIFDWVVPFVGSSILGGLAFSAGFLLWHVLTHMLQIDRSNDSGGAILYIFVMGPGTAIVSGFGYLVLTCVAPAYAVNTLLGASGVFGFALSFFAWRDLAR